MLQCFHFPDLVTIGIQYQCSDMLIIPNELIDKFVSVSSQNVSKEDGKHLETLAFLSGIRQNGNLIGSDLIFPRQNCRPNSVEEQGKKASLFSKVTKEVIVVTSVSASANSRSFLRLKRSFI